MVKNPPANSGEAGDINSIPGSRRSPGGENGNSLRYSCLESSVDRGACRDIVHGITESDMTEHTHHTLNFL